MAVCADEGEARRMAADLQAFTGEEAVVLPGREFRFHPAAVTSRGLKEDDMVKIAEAIKLTIIDGKLDEAKAIVKELTEVLGKSF